MQWFQKCKYKSQTRVYKKKMMKMQDTLRMHMYDTLEDTWHTEDVHVWYTWRYMTHWGCTCMIHLKMHIEQNMKVKVYSLVSNMKRYSPDFTQSFPGHRTCSFINHLNSPGMGGAYSSSAISSAQNYSNTQAFIVLPGTHFLLGQESARVGKVPCLGAQRRGIIQPSWGLNPQSLACKL